MIEPTTPKELARDMTNQMIEGLKRPGTLSQYVIETETEEGGTRFVGTRFAEKIIEIGACQYFDAELSK